MGYRFGVPLDRLLKEQNERKTRLTALTTNGCKMFVAKPVRAVGRALSPRAASAASEDAAPLEETLSPGTNR
jgi:hypothetical protein